MKKLFMFIITALFLCITTAACKKDKNDTDGTPVATLAKIDSVIHYKHDTSREFTKYFYDSQGRVVRILYNDGSIDSLVYSSAQVLWKEYWTDGQLAAIDAFILDSRGLAIMVNPDSKRKDRSSAIHLRERLNFNSNTSISTQILREYDANKYLVKKTDNDYFYYGDTAIYLYTIKNGNVSNMILTRTNPEYPQIVTETISYYTNKQNTIGDQNSGITFLGKQNNNLYKTIIYNEGSYYPPDSTHYWYKFDAKNRVIMRYFSSTLALYVDSTRYTYKD